MPALPRQPDFREGLKPVLKKLDQKQTKYIYIASNARTKAEKANDDADNAIIEAEQARSTAKEAKEMLLKIQKDSEEMLFKLKQAEHARAVLEKHI